MLICASLAYALNPYLLQVAQMHSDTCAFMYDSQLSHRVKPTTLLGKKHSNSIQEDLLQMVMKYIWPKSRTDGGNNFHICRADNEA